MYILYNSMYNNNMYNVQARQALGSPPQPLGGLHSVLGIYKVVYV